MKLNEDIKNKIETLAHNMIKTVEANEKIFPVEPSLIFDGYQVGKTMAEAPANECYIGNLGELGVKGHRNGSHYGEYEGNEIYGELNSLILDHFLALDLFTFDGFEEETSVTDENVKGFFEGIDYLIEVLTIKGNDYIPFKAAIISKTKDLDFGFSLKEMKEMAKDVVNHETASTYHEYFFREDDDQFFELMEIKKFFLEIGLVYIDGDSYDEMNKGKPLAFSAGNEFKNIDDNIEKYIEEKSLSPYKGHWAKNFLKGINE